MPADRRTNVVTQIKGAITRFDKAAQEYAFKGSLHPSEADVAEREHRMARAALERLIQRNLK